MLIKAPKAIEDILLEDQLEPQEETERSLFKDVDENDYPIVTIGKPIVYPLRNLDEQNKEKSLVDYSAIMQKNDFYFVRFTCSFRTRPSINIDWAEFMVNMALNHQAETFSAYDLFPKHETSEVKRGLKVHLSPSLKFEIASNSAEISPGEIGYTIEFTQLQPSVVANGWGESRFSWDYQQTKVTEVTGCKAMYVILQVPKGTKRISAYIELSADISTSGRSILAYLKPDKKSEEERLYIRNLLS